MFPPFETDEAHRYCLELISAIENGVLYFKQITPESEERKNQGNMLGSLVCKDKKGRKIILHSISGISKNIFVNKKNTGKVKILSKNRWTSDGIEHIIVPPLVSDRKITRALKKNDRKIHELTKKIDELKPSHKDCSFEKDLRIKLCDKSLKKVFSLYSFTCADKAKISLNKIIKEKYGTLPPTGTGDCCAPKLLSYAFSHDYIPLSMDEVYYGPDTQKKTNLVSYPPCDERCGFILPYILKLEIIYRDSQIIVVNKQSGVLSVPGRGKKKFDSIETRVRTLFPECIKQPAVHRLDMETSGILVLAFTKEAHRELNRQFQEGEVSKKYTALLDGLLEDARGEMAPEKNQISGIMKLKFRLDPDNRPHQIYDEVYGKEGITEWKKEGTKLFINPVTGEKKRLTRVTFIPHTGRTHQLRLASADLHGFGLPITGDALYGECKEGERLMLHAGEITFKHPLTKELLHFEVPSPF